MIYVVGLLSFAVAIRYFGVSDPLAAALFLLAFGGRDATRRRRPGLDDGRARQRVQPSRACCAPELERRDRVRRAGGGGLVVFAATLATAGSSTTCCFFTSSRSTSRGADSGSSCTSARPVRQHALYVFHATRAELRQRQWYRAKRPRLGGMPVSDGVGVLYPRSAA